MTTCGLCSAQIRTIQGQAHLCSTTTLAFSTTHPRQTWLQQLRASSGKIAVDYKRKCAEKLLIRYTASARRSKDILDTGAQKSRINTSIRTATAVAHCKAGQGLIRVNGRPLSLVEPALLRFKVYEPILILGTDKFGTTIFYNPAK